jgi:hypothetical protein
VKTVPIPVEAIDLLVDARSTLMAAKRGPSECVFAHIDIAQKFITAVIDQARAAGCTPGRCEPITGRTGELRGSETRKSATDNYASEHPQNQADGTYEEFT